jgi:hypothetical protein
MRLQATDEGLFAVNLFIAELHGVKNLPVEDKASIGYQKYLNKELLSLDLSTQEDRDELHTNIWLERLYEEVSQYETNKLMRALDSTIEPFKWSVPIELDASASMLGYIGCLLGEKRLLEATNVSYSGVMRDPWHQPTMSRKLFKAPAMRLIYGSTQSAPAIWNKEKIQYTPHDAFEFSKILNSGAFGVANDLKDFIISYCNPTEVMNPKVWGVTYQVNCNRYRQVGEKAVKYDIYDSDAKRIRRVTHVKTKSVPDLKSFKRFWVTNLIHHLDSRVADTVCEKAYDKYGFIIDIHDAFICSPEAASDIRHWYAEEMQKIYENRHEILQDYFQSININSNATTAWNKLMSKVEPIENFVASPWTLK